MVDLNQKGDDELRNGIEAMIQEVKEDPLSQKCCIYKVARSTSEKNENMYTPTTISIGPFHNGDPKLKDMERYKVIMLKRFMTSLSLDNLIRFVRRLEPKVRASYSEVTLAEEEFQRLMLLDGAFIIELFCSFRSCRSSDDNTLNMNAILRQPKFLSVVTKDLLLLENQLPFFFLEGLYQQAFPADDVGNPSFAELSCEFFGSFNSQSLSPESDGFRINHFTDLLRLFHLPKELPERVPLPWSGNDVLQYSAKQLAEIDIKFKVASLRSSGPLDLKFSNEVLEVPRIWVDDNTAILFHNMITFEQCHYPGDQHYISDYALLLHCLVNSQEDVSVLIRNGIIRNCLGDPSEVVRIFDGHYTDLTLWKFNSKYLWICGVLNHMGSDHWRQIRPTLKRQFLRFITGLQLNNLLTLIQTIIAICKQRNII